MEIIANIMRGIFQRKMIVLLVAFVLLFVVMFNSGFFGGKDTRLRITCVGDSLTYGSGVLKTKEVDCYPAKLQMKIGTSSVVSNFGLRNATASLEGDVPYINSAEYEKSLQSKPDVVLLMLGTNDSKTYNWNADDYEEGLRTLVESYQQLDTNPTVILMRSPYCFSLDGAEVAEYDIQPEVVKNEVSAIIEKVAAETKVDVIDLYSPTYGREKLYTDGIHFNAHGYNLIASTIEKKIKELDDQVSEKTSCLF